MVTCRTLDIIITSTMSFSYYSPYWSTVKLPHVTIIKIRERARRWVDDG